jgi:Iron-containing redox enzyme
MLYEVAHETLDDARIAKLQDDFAWLVQPIRRAVQHVQRMPFFDWVDSLRSPLEFKQAAVQLYQHSATFPKVMGLMLAHTPPSENYMLPFYAEHAYTEAPHHRMLMGWMLRHNILEFPDEIDLCVPTLATNACINVAYQLAEERDREKWIVTINCGIELCSNEFFKVVAPKMRSLGAGHAYFDVHVEADEFHSVMGLEHVAQHDTDSDKRRILIGKALEGISLWAAMIHSWIGLNTLPQFELDGRPADHAV